MTLDAALVETLSRWLAATDIDRLDLTGPEGSLTLHRGGAAPPEAHTPEPAAIDVVAPALGLFLDRHPLATRPFVELGEEVAAGELLACLQVGALLTPVRAPQAGIVAVRVPVAGALVGYGTILFRLHPLQIGDRP
jgi:acetyl-CoA carboxylase biotin carboxyl carrier protein